MSKTIVITGASSGFGALTARRLADADHTVYAGMRDTTGRNAPQVGAAKRYAAKNDVDLRTIELDVSEPTPLARPRAAVLWRAGLRLQEGALHPFTTRRSRTSWPGFGAGMAGVDRLAELGLSEAVDDLVQGRQPVEHRRLEHKRSAG
jgi:nucleoside-diphosphate-sugar epimerase